MSPVPSFRQGRPESSTREGKPSLGRQVRCRFARRGGHAEEEPPPAPCRRRSPRRNRCEFGPARAWRIRVGDYRVFYDIRFEPLPILVADIGERSTGRADARRVIRRR